MSCDVAASLTLWLAAVGAHPQTEVARLLQPISAAAAPSSLAREPLYADIVARAKALEKQVQRYEATGGATPDFEGFRSRVEALAALDMKGHLDLAQRGTDGDLKCILKGISQDLPKKLDEMAGATTPDARIQALKDMAYLLNDNVEVITAPPRPEV
jgi:hypothetical protein